MTAKYSPIAQFLMSIPAQTSDVTLSFDKISEILKFPLPASALKYQAWWSYERKPKQPQKLCWQRIGWQVDEVDFSREEVRFRHVTSTSSQIGFGKSQNPDDTLKPVSQSYSAPVSIETNLSMMIQKATWNPVFVIPKGTVLIKGRHGLYHSMTQAAAGISNRYGCYSWGSQSRIFYCGSFAQDYIRGGFKSNLQARIHNYL